MTAETTISRQFPGISTEAAERLRTEAYRVLASIRTARGGRATIPSDNADIACVLDAAGHVEITGSSVSSIYVLIKQRKGGRA